jgi:hypothetical protein
MNLDLASVKIKSNFIYIISWFFTCSVMLNHFTNQNNDYLVFHKAGSQLLAGVNPWDFSGDTQAMWLYGPVTLLYNTGLSILPIQVGLTLIRILTLLSILIIAFFLANNVLQVNPFILAIFFMLSYPVRACLEYGRTDVIIALITLRLLYRLSEPRNFPNLYILTFYSALILDYKPHLAIPILGILLIHGFRKVIIILFSIYLMVFAYFYLIYKINFLESWYSSIRIRQPGASKTADQISLSSLTSDRIGIVFFVLACILILLQLIHMRYLKNNFKDTFTNYLSVMLFFITFGIFLHPTDVFLHIIMCLCLVQKSYTLVNIFCLGCFLVWSPNIHINIVLMVLNFACFYKLNLNNFRSKPKFIFALFVPLTLYTVLVLLEPNQEEPARRFLQYLSLLFVTLLSAKSNLLLNKNTFHMIKAWKA